MNTLLQDIRYATTNRKAENAMPTMNPNRAELASGTRSRLQQRNLSTADVFFLLTCLPLVLCFAAVSSGKTKKPAPAPLAPGAYFGLKLPGDTPELFAPGIINIPGRSVGHLAFSPDGAECYFTVYDGVYLHNRILFTRYENGAWTPQASVPFVSGKENFEPLFSRDGHRDNFKSLDRLSRIERPRSHGDSPPTAYPVSTPNSSSDGSAHPARAKFSCSSHAFMRAELPINHHPIHLIASGHGDEKPRDMGKKRQWRTPAITQPAGYPPAALDPVSA
jgi:hypothetical protein